MGALKAKGTRREKRILDMLTAAGLVARRAGNNLPSKDLEADLPGMSFAIEVKDRRNLTVHRTITDVQTNWPTQIPVVVWHRTEKTEPEGRAKPVGPTIAAMPVEDFVKLLGTLNWALSTLRQPQEGMNDGRELDV